MESSQWLDYIEETLQKFSGTDKIYSVSRWIEDMDVNAEIFNWTDEEKLGVARRSLIGAAALWLKSRKTFNTYDELKVAIAMEFPGAINVKEMHEIMAARKKREDETYYEYMLVMKGLSKRANFPDFVGIKYIIDGIPDTEINKVMLYGVTTFECFKEKLVIYEKIKEKEKSKQQMSNGRTRTEGHFFKCEDFAPVYQSTKSYVAREAGEKHDRSSESGEARSQGGFHTHTMLTSEHRPLTEVNTVSSEGTTMEQQVDTDCGYARQPLSHIPDTNLQQPIQSMNNNKKEQNKEGPIGQRITFKGDVPIQRLRRFYRKREHGNYKKEYHREKVIKADEYVRLTFRFHYLYKITGYEDKGDYDVTMIGGPWKTSNATGYIEPWPDLLYVFSPQQLEQADFTVRKQ